MSLVSSKWIMPAAAAAIAAIVPIWLLQSDEPEAAAPARIAVTRLDIPVVGGIEAARAAPIFSPTRSTVELAAASGGEEGAPAAAPAVAAPPPRLVGLVSRARGKGVALVKKSDGETVTLAPGESVDGWRLSSIGRTSASFTANGERRDVALDFGNRNPVQTAGPAPQIPLPPPISPSTPAARTEPEL